MSSPCTQKQAACLERNGYNPDEFDFDSASELIDALKANNWEPLDEPAAPKPTRKPAVAKKSGGTAVAKKPAIAKKGEKPVSKRDRNGPATEKQLKILDEYGYETEGVTFGDASDLIDRIAENGWQPLDEE